MAAWIKELPLVFFSRDFYVRLVRQGQGIGMRFIIMNMVLSLLVMLYGMVSALPAMQGTIQMALDRMPDISIKAQKLSINQPSPYTVHISDNPKMPAVLFDTDAQPSVTEINNIMVLQNLAGLITADFVAVRDQNKTQFYYFKDYTQLNDKQVTVTHDDWIYYAKEIFLWMLPVAGIIALVGLFVWRMLATVLQAVIVLLFGLAGKVRPDFEGAMRLAGAAALPPAFIAFLLAPMHKSLPFVIAVLIWMGYAVYGLVVVNLSLKQDKIP